MNIKVSVIVPVYNADPYLSECIQSLLNQTIDECEFIFVNDGSTDDSASIIERYLQIDSRMIYIHQSNQGVSVARNIGVEAAKGAYIGFVDADDYIEADMYERLYEAALEDECDIVLSNFESEMDGHYMITKYPFPSDRLLNEAFIREEVLPTFLKTECLNTACNKLYRTSLIKNHKISFPKQVALGEDGIFNMDAFSFAKKMKYIDYTGYHYRETRGSATRDVLRNDYFRRAMEVYLTEPPEFYKQLLEHETIQQLKAIKFIHSVMAYIHIYLKPTVELSTGEQIKYVRNMIENKEVSYALPIYMKVMQFDLSRYEKLLLNFMSRKSWLGLYCLTAYSRLRNR